MASLKRPKNPKFPKRPKSDDVSVLKNWEDRCSEIRKSYDVRFREFAEQEKKKKTILDSVKNLKNLHKAKVKRAHKPKPAKKSKGKKKGKK